MAVFTDLPSDVLIEVYSLSGPLSAASLLGTSRHAKYGWEHSEIKWMARWRPTACFKALILKKDYRKALALLACTRATPGASLNPLLAVSASHGSKSLIKACLDVGADVEATMAISLQVLTISRHCWNSWLDFCSNSLHSPARVITVGPKQWFVHQALLLKRQPQAAYEPCMPPRSTFLRLHACCTKAHLAALG